MSDTVRYVTVTATVFSNFSVTNTRNNVRNQGGIHFAKKKPGAYLSGFFRAQKLVVKMICTLIFK